MRVREGRCFLCPLRLLLVTLALTLGASGCSVLRFWNPLADGVEHDGRITVRQGGVALEVRSFEFINGSGPEVTLVIANETRGAVAARPDAFRLASGDSLLAPRSAPEAFTLPPGEAREIGILFPIQAEHWDGPRGMALTLVPGGIEAAGAVVAFGPIQYVNPRRER